MAIQSGKKATQKGRSHLLRERGRVDAIEFSEAVPQHAETHGGLDNVHALQLEVVDRVEGGDADRVGLGQPQELLGGRGNGLTGWFGPGG